MTLTAAMGSRSRKPRPEIDPAKTLLDARAALLAFRYGEAQALVAAYRAWRRRTGSPEPAFPMHPPAFYSASFREPIGGDWIARSILDAVKRGNHDRRVCIDWMMPSEAQPESDENDASVANIGS